MEPKRLLPGDPTLVENIVNYLKAKGIFDEFRHECLADVDTKSSCQNLSQRVDGYASKFLANETWHPDLNKNELRNKLRRHIDESGMLAVGADHVVEQVINPKIHQLFLPKIIEVVQQYMKEQNEMLNKKQETTSTDNTITENVSDTSDSSKAKTSVTDPIADILSFSHSKTKSASTSSIHCKTDVSQKYADVSKLEKKKEEKSSPVLEKSTLESPIESPVIPPVIEPKPQPEKEKEKTKKDELEVPLTETPKKKEVKEEIKSETKKSDDTKSQSCEIDTLGEENKASVSHPNKPNILGKKDSDKDKQKSKHVNPPKTSNTSSELKKPKKESLDKSSEKLVKSKLQKPSKESSSPTKSVSSVKSVSKDEKSGEISKPKPSDSCSSKTSELPLKKSSKSSSNKKDISSSKHKIHREKTEKNKIPKLSDKSDHSFHHESSNSDKTPKNIQYSSSYDSSQGSDQEKSSSSSSKKERQKHFSKHAKKDKSEKDADKSSKASYHKKISKENEERGNPSKKFKTEKSAAQEKFKESITMGEAAKISSRSNSFGSTSSVSSSSNTSKDNLISNSDETVEGFGKGRKKKQMKNKESCHNFKTLPPPPPPPPPSGSLSCELTSSAEVSSIEDTQSSSDSENSSNEDQNEQSSSDSEEVEAKESVLNTLNENALNSSTDDINAFYDIFLYSSSSSEFEGYGSSPEKQRVENVLKKINESDISVSSVHTSDLSSYDDELSDDDFVFNEESQPGVKKRLTLKEAQELLQRRKEIVQSLEKNKDSLVENKSDDDGASSNKRCLQRSLSLLSSEDESFTSEPKRSLRRERKLNPRYASSEYTSIFNSRKETFITKQSSPYVKSQFPSSSPLVDRKHKKETTVEKDKSFKKNSVESKPDTMQQDNAVQPLKTKRKLSISETLAEANEFNDSSEISSSDEINSIMDKEKFLPKNDKTNNDSQTDQLKLKFKFKTQNNSNYSLNSYSVKRKLKDVESIPAKRPCSRGSVDSSSSECVPNENKPFNNEKHVLSSEKVIRDIDFKGSDLSDAIKKDLFCKQRINNNGDILGQKDIFSKNSLGKTISTPEKKTSETENNKELNAL